MAEMELREQIARAIFDVRDGEFDLDEWDELDAAEKERYLCDADAVLASGVIVRIMTAAEVRGQVKALRDLVVEVMASDNTSREMALFGVGLVGRIDRIEREGRR